MTNGLWVTALLVVAGSRALAQTAPDVRPSEPPAARAPVHHDRHHRHHFARHVHLEPVPQAAPPPAQQTDAAGTTPAPVPNEDIGPPRAPAETSPSLDPGSLHLHYPPLGDGFLPGSSPQDMANTQTPKVPGATYTVPLPSAPPQTLPPPGADR